MKNIINTILGIVFLLTIVGFFISLFFSRLNIGTLSFNLPLVFVFIFFLLLFIAHIKKTFITNKLYSFGTIIGAIFFLLIVIIMVYFALFLPFQNELLYVYKNYPVKDKIEDIQIEAERDTKIYFEMDVSNIQYKKMDKVEIKIKGPNNSQLERVVYIGSGDRDKDKKIVKITHLFFVFEKVTLPFEGTYNFEIENVDRRIIVDQIRIFKSKKDGINYYIKKLSDKYLN